jgi:peptidoglycan/LPS O-acetylase OafA/YrhL
MTEPVVEPPPGNPRFPLFDSVRGIAVLMVVVVHGGYISGAAQGAWYGDLIARLEFCLPIFFLVSAFLLYRPFVAARVHARPSPSTRRFLRARALRILPAYWVALTLLTLYPGLPQLWSDHWWAYYGFLSVYDANWAFGGILPAWSLCIEVTFYLALPLFAAFVMRAGGMRREWLAVGALFVAGVAFNAIVHIADGDRVDTNLYLTLPAALQWLALGMALAVASVWLETRPETPRAVRWVERMPGLAWGLALVLFLFVSLGIGLDSESPHLGITVDSPESTTLAQWLAEGILYGLIAALLLLPAVFGDRLGGLPRRVLRNPLLAWIGVISYGIFLWHLPIMAWLANDISDEPWGESRMLGITGVGLVLAIACAAASYYAVERPLLRLKRPSRTATAPRSSASATSTTKVSSAAWRKRGSP